MKQKQIFLIGIILLVVTSSCKKITQEWFKTKLEGTVTVKQTGEPLRNIKLKIINCQICDYPNSYSNVDSFYSDNTGKFEFKFNAEKDGSLYENTYYLVVDSACYSWNCSPGTLLIEKGKKNSYDIIATSSTRVLFHLCNKFPHDENDKIEFSFGYINETYDGNNIDVYLDSFEDYYKDHYEIYKYIRYNYSVTKSGITKHYIDSVYLQTPCTIDTITINY